MSSSASAFSRSMRSKNVSYVGNAIFVVGRLASVALQFWLLSHAFRNSSEQGALALRIASPCISLWLIAVSNCYDALFTRTNGLPIAAALLAVLVEGTLDWIVAMTTMHAKHHANVYIQIVSLVCVMSGVGLETLANTQKAAFLESPRNQGRILDRGFFAIVRHPAYTGFCLYRSAAMGSTGRMLPTAGVALALVAYFTMFAIRELAFHMHDKHGERWEQYCRQTRYALIPFIL